MKKLFIVILRYLVPYAEVNIHRSDHINYLTLHHKSGMFMMSGRQNPLTGGMIMAKCNSRKELLAILSEDPYAKLDLAEYQVFEYHPARCNDECELFKEYIE